LDFNKYLVSIRVHFYNIPRCDPTCSRARPADEYLSAS